MVVEISNDFAQMRSFASFSCRADALEQDL